MGIGTDRVRVLKIEDASFGGNENDNGPYGVDPIPINPQQDAVECAGIFVKDETSDSNDVAVFRNGDDLRFCDKRSGNNYPGYTLTQLLAGGFNLDIILTNQQGEILIGANGNILTSG
jgi:hypothetical protein